MNALQSFFVAEADGWRATELTRGPWSIHHQHGGPPAALMARALEGAAGGFAVARMTVELLKAIPLTLLAVAVTPLRTGRKVQWLDAELRDVEGTVLARARAVCMRSAALDLNVHAANLDPLPSPEASAPFEFPFFQGDVGYHTAMETRLARGKFWGGQVAMWMRMRHPLVPGEAPSPLQRVMIAADSGNGISVLLDPRRYTFVNPDLTVHLHRQPRGEWVCLDARTIPQAHGVGLADTRLLDEHGELGRSAQSLIIEART